MKFRILSEALRPVARSTARYFSDNWGVSRFRVEEALPTTNVARRPTLHAVTRDKQILCIEVSESPFPRGLDSFVLDCINNCVPMRLFIAVPASSSNDNFKADLARARNCGVGVLEVSDNEVTKLCDALSLSLVSVRPVTARDFPKKYRMALSRAYGTFRDGDPVKGCSTVYDEVEALSRRVAEKTQKKGLWHALKPGEKAPKINFETAKWSTLIRILMEHLDHKKHKSLTQSLLGSLLGLTTARNESSHKIKTVSDLVRRDKRLKTRFENAIDILSDLIRATKSLRV